jgi:hypothetical protein
MPSAKKKTKAKRTGKKPVRGDMKLGISGRRSRGDMKLGISGRRSRSSRGSRSSR